MKIEIKFKYHENGVIASEHQEIDGNKWNGYHKAWYANGNKHHKSIWINGNINGNHEVWFENGSRDFAEQIKNGVGHGFGIYFKYKK